MTIIFIKFQTILWFLLKKSMQNQLCLSDADPVSDFHTPGSRQGFCNTRIVHDESVRKTIQCCLYFLEKKVLIPQIGLPTLLPVSRKILPNYSKPFEKNCYYSEETIKNCEFIQ